MIRETSFSPIRANNYDGHPGVVEDKLCDPPCHPWNEKKNNRIYEFVLLLSILVEKRNLLSFNRDAIFSRDEERSRTDSRFFIYFFLVASEYYIKNDSPTYLLAFPSLSI